MNLRGRPVVAVVALFAVFGSRPIAGGTANDDRQVRPQPVRWPGEGGKKVAVKLGIVAVDFARINLREESCVFRGDYGDNGALPVILTVPSAGSAPLQ